MQKSISSRIAEFDHYGGGRGFITDWWTGSPAHTEDLERIHVRAARVGHRLPRDIPDDEILRLAKWDRLDYIYIRKLLSMMHKVFQQTAPEALVNHFSRKLSRSRDSLSFELPRWSREIGRTSVRWRGPLLWNTIFFKIRNLLPLYVLLCLYNALFLSFLQYGLIVWGQTFASYIDPIFKLQKKAVRAISFQPRLSPSFPIFKDLKLLKLSEIFELRLLTFVYDSVNKTSPCCFHDFFLFSSSVHQYSTRQASQGDLYLYRMNSLRCGLSSIPYLGAKLWNTLPVDLRNAPSKVSFKKQLKLHLLNAVNE